MKDRDIPGLLPCPFCGSSNGIFLNHRPLNIGWVVECAGCKARGPEVHTNPVKDEDRESASKRARKQAAENWNNNRRTPEMIREWMDKEACSECGEFFHKEDLFETEFGRMCHDCYREMKELEEMLQ